MAIQKNFVVKNGLEVNDNLIFADTTINSVGIATTIANYTLHVNGGIGATDLYVSGIATANAFYGDGSNLTFSGPLSLPGLVVSGVSTLGVTTATDLTLQNLYVSGIGTINSGFITNFTGVAGTITTLSVTNGSVTNLTGTAGTITTLSVTNGSVTNLTGTAATIGVVQISSGIVTASSGIVTYYGDGQYLQNILSGVGVATEGGTVGTGATILDFRGAGISTVTVASGIATINITGGGGGGGGAIGIGSTFPGTPASLDPAPSSGDLFFHIDYGRTFLYYDEVALGIGATAVWIDSAPFNQGGLYVNKYGDNMYAGLGVTIGTLTNPSVYFNGYTNSGFYSPAANEFGVVVSGTEKLNVNAGGINITGVATATTLSSTNLNSTNVNVTGVVTATSFKGSAQVGVATGGTYIGLTTQFNFVGSGVSVTHEYNATAGITTVNLFVEAAAGGGGSGQFNTGITSSLGYAVTNSMATAYTAADTVVVHSIHVTNIDGTDSADISGQLYSGQYSIAYTVPVPAGSSVELLKQPKVLNTGETIQLQASVNGDLHATISLEPKTGDTTYIGVGADITSAATYTDLWVATADAVLQGILLSNDDGAADVKANVVWTDGSNNIQGYYTYEMIIPADATVEVLEQPKFLPNGYKVRVLANQANRLEAILSARTIA